MDEKRFTALLFLVVFIVYLASPITMLADSRYYLYLSSSLINRASPDFRADVEKAGIMKAGKPIPYQFAPTATGGITNYTPHGTAFLVAPFVKIAEMAGVVWPENGYDPIQEGRIQHCIASLFTAIGICALYAAIRKWLPRLQSFLITAAMAFGTSYYSTASRVLWSHTAELMLCSIGLALALWYRREERIVIWLLLASVVAWLPFVRPTAALSSLGLLVISARISTRYIISTLAALAFWAILFGLYFKGTFGSFLPQYFEPSRLNSSKFFTAFLGNTISPSRGIFVYSPFILLSFLVFLPSVIKALTRYQRCVVGVSLAVIVGHLLAISRFPHWWGGHSIGPRLVSDALPWFGLTVAAFFAGAERSRTLSSDACNTRPAKGFWYAFGLLCLVVLGSLSIAFHAYASLSMTPWRWNVTPTDVDASPERVFPWKYAQPWAGLFRLHYSGPNISLPFELKPTAPGAEKFLHGFSGPEGDFRWTDGREALIVFGSDRPQNVRLRMRLGAFLGKNVEAQPITLSLNDSPLATFYLYQQEPVQIEIPISGRFFRENNVLKLSIPCATRPRDVSDSLDSRQLGVSLFDLVLEPR